MTDRLRRFAEEIRATDIGKPLRRWEDDPLHEPTPGQPVPGVDDDPVPLDPVEDPARIEEEVPAGQLLARAIATGEIPTGINPDVPPGTIELRYGGVLVKRLAGA